VFTRTCHWSGLAILELSFNVHWSSNVLDEEMNETYLKFESKAKLIEVTVLWKQVKSLQGAIKIKN
jgi:hypothetical protein